MTSRLQKRQIRSDPERRSRNGVLVGPEKLERLLHADADFQLIVDVQAFSSSLGMAQEHYHQQHGEVKVTHFEVKVTFEVSNHMREEHSHGTRYFRVLHSVSACTGHCAEGCTGH